MTGPRAATLAGGLDLLERSLHYTRSALAEVGPGDLRRPTPCAGWSLGDLLAHMEDSLDTFTEAATGRVDLAPATTGLVPGPRVDRLQAKACALLGAWRLSARDDRSACSGAGLDGPGGATVGGLALGAGLLVAMAALEVTVHGWDVGWSLSPARPVPEPLAESLLEVAHVLVGPEDRVTRFAAPVAVPVGAPASARLVGFLGRAPDHQPPSGGRLGKIPAERPSRVPRDS
ncbi:TIGR03086 family metal-binding protein [Nocardioides sp. GCM10027113]|uniref:TIGR03086 family metal-binding protein n=1 Tax=unclassified Nocardioides TaxID=2615069 RepID=UPI00362034B1